MSFLQNSWILFEGKARKGKNHSAIPNILSGLKVVLAIAWTCVISAEMVGANSGLGFRIWTAKEWSDTGQVLVGMLCISLTVLVLDIIYRVIEKVLLPWKRMS